MINNDYSNALSKYLNNRAAGNEKSSAADVYKKLKEKRDQMMGKTSDAKPADADSEAEAAANSTADKAAAEKKGSASDAAPETTAGKQSSGLKELLDRINSEIDQGLALGSSQNQSSNVTFSNDKMAEMMNVDDLGFPEFLNDLPLFSQFKEDLAAAFSTLDGSTAGAISAQYELNYTSVQMIANEAGGYDVTETTYNFKLDLAYVKASQGLDKNASIGETFGLGKGASAKDMMSSLEDYWSSENTAGRITDFATAFFGNSKEFKELGDTEEARAAFAERMGAAIQKGFDQAMGTLGKVPKGVQDTVDKTHQLVFDFLDSFVKNGMNWRDVYNADKSGDKSDDGSKNNSNNGSNNASGTDNGKVISSLQAYSLSMNQNYSQKTYSISAEQANNYLYGKNGAAAGGTGAAPALDAEA